MTIIDLIIKYGLLTAIICDASLAWFVLLKNPRQAVNQAYWMMMTAGAIWQISNFLLCYYPFASETSASMSLHLTYPAAGLATYLVWYFCDLFPRNTHNRKKLTAILISWLIFGGIIISTDWLVEVLYFGGTGINAFEYHWLYGFFIASVIVGVTLIFHTLWKKYKATENPREKIRVQYLITGLGILTSIAVCTNLIAPIIRNIVLHMNLDEAPFIYNIGPTASIFFSGIVAYAILRHRLLDIKVILQRKWFSVILAIIILGSITIGVTLWQRSWLMLGWATVTAIALYFPVQRGLEQMIRQRIKKQIIDLFKLTTLERQMLENCTRPDSFFRTLTSQIMQRVPLEQLHCIVYDPIARYYTTAYTTGQFPHLATDHNVDEPWISALRRQPRMVISSEIVGEGGWQKAEVEALSSFCDKQGVSIIIPLFSQAGPYAEVLGILLVGNRIDQAPLSNEDRAFLNEVQKTSSSMIYHVIQIYHAVTTRLDMTERVQSVLQARAIASTEREA